MGCGGAGSKIVPNGKSVAVGGMYTPGMTALISSTRAESVGVSVGSAVVVAVGDGVIVGVLVVVGVWVGVGVCVGVWDGVSDGSTNSVGNAATSSFCDWCNTKTADQTAVVSAAIIKRINT